MDTRHPVFVGLQKKVALLERRVEILLEQIHKVENQTLIKHRPDGWNEEKP